MALKKAESLIIFRYLSRELFTSMAAVTGILLMILMSSRLIYQLTAAAAGKIPLEIVFFTLLLRMPSFLEMILPLSLFIAILLAYGRLYAESEMTVLTATGFSSTRLLGYTLLPAGVITVLVAFFSLYLSPLGAQKMEDLYRKQATMTEFELLVPGRFQSTAKGSRVTYTEGLSDDKSEMKNVFIADGNTILLAQTGTQKVNPDTGSRFLELHKGKRFDITPGKLDVEVLDFDLYGVKIADEQAERRRIKKEAIPTSELFGNDSKRHSSQLQWRFSLIIMVPICAMIAFPLSKVNPRQGRFARIFPAIILFMMYITLLISLRGMLSKGDISPAIGMWWVHAVYALIGLGLLFIPEWNRRRKIRSL
ncbi:MAG: lipopolysaccharide export system permease protein [Oleispira sp.]|jgi:lipopolysaccharide export system permease protein